MKKEQIPQHLEQYFIDLRDKEGIELSPGQKWWYYRQWCVLGDRIKQEYPSTAQEAFCASADAYFFAEEIKRARDERRIIPLRYDPEHLVYVSFDIGMFDHTVLWFYQLYDQNIYVIDYYEDNNKSYAFYIHHMMQNKPYNYGTVFLPHDAAKRDDETMKSYADKIRGILDAKHVSVEVLKKDDLIAGINLAKVTINRCYFDSVKCAQGIDHLGKYKRKWNEQAGWVHEPQKNVHSHAADSYRYLTLSVDRIKRIESAPLEKHRAALERAKRVI